MRPWHHLKLYKALSHKPIFILWTGEALSAVGDEIYKVALTWIAVGMIGNKAGYLSAAQAGTVLVFGLLGGYWADRWSPRRTMLYADLGRGLLVLLPVLWVQFYSLNIWVLLAVAVLVAALSAFFEPALQAVVPRLARNRDLLQATNGLMGTTNRLARALGPSLVGALTGVIPILHFFTLDALSFGCSAWAVAVLKKNLPESAPPFPHSQSTVLSGFALLRGDPLLKYTIYVKALTSGAWNLVLPLGIALLVEKLLPGNIRAYGLLLASYGVANVSAALVLSNLTMQRPMRVMGLGFVMLGLGFFVMAALPSLPWMMWGAAIAAVGGPMNDLAHIDVIQRRFPPEQLVPIVRFRMTIEYAGIFVSFLLAPMLFGWLGPLRVIALAGLVNFLVGVVGLVKFGERSSTNATP